MLFYLDLLMCFGRELLQAAAALLLTICIEGKGSKICFLEPELLKKKTRMAATLSMRYLCAGYPSKLSKHLMRKCKAICYSEGTETLLNTFPWHMWHVW